MQLASSRKLKIPKDEQKTEVMRKSYLEGERAKNLGLEARGRRPTDAEIKQHCPRKIMFTGDDEVWRRAARGGWYLMGHCTYEHLDSDLEASDEDDAMGTCETPSPTKVPTGKLLEQRDRLSVSEYKASVSSPRLVADVKTPEATPLSEIGDTSKIKTPMCSPIRPEAPTSEKPADPEPGEVDGDKPTQPNRERALTAVASA